MMPAGMWVVVGWVFLVALTGAAFFAWARDNGQFDDIEEAKYKMLEERDPLPWGVEPETRSD